MKKTKFNPMTVQLVKLFESHQNAAQALAMERYMKNHFAFYGIKAPLRKELSKSFLKEHGKPADTEIRGFIRELWELPERELQYFAQELLATSKKQLQESDDTLIAYLITTRSWWDTVDFVASNIAGPYFKKFPAKIDPVTRSWMDSGNIWLQRSALLFQLKYRNQTDHLLLSQYIIELSSHNDFFIRKAIGWVLREFSKHNPEWVISFLKHNRLKPLSEKEARKYLG